MGTVIYSASPFRAFVSEIFTLLFLLGYGTYTLVGVLRRRGDKALARVGWGIFGGLLIVAGLVLTAFVFRQMTASAQTVAVIAQDKNVVTRSCGEDDTCTDYILETSGRLKTYDFDVPERAYEQVQAGTCYYVTYFRASGLFGGSGANDSHEATSHVTRIEVADTSACLE